MTDFIYEDAFEPDVNIKVIGVGGGPELYGCIRRTGY